MFRWAPVCSECSARARARFSRRWATPVADFESSWAFLPLVSARLPQVSQVDKGRHLVERSLAHQLAPTIQAERGRPEMPLRFPLPHHFIS